MEELFGYKLETLQRLKASHTAKEIHQQPTIWLNVLELINTQKNEIQSFLNTVLCYDDLQIILSGAGTSAFAGEVVEPVIHQLVKHHVRAIATTDLVSNPRCYFSPEKPTLLISFARSGNSPESVAAVELANTCVKTIYHLVITCNEAGALAKMANAEENAYLLLMPPQTNDQSFAMTSSCTSMILSSLVVFDLENLKAYEADLRLAQINLTTFFNDLNPVDELIEYNFNRLIILGGGTLKGIAREMALKMLELSAGIVNANYDTPLGFRHGPKSVIDDGTLTIVLRHNDAYASLYDEDLIKELKREEKLNKVVVLSHHPDATGECYFKEVIQHPVILGLQYLVFGQLLALKKSLALNITPDNPCPTGEVNRVVQGVTIYPYRT